MSTCEIKGDFEFLKIGDILFFETPFKDARADDYFPFEKNQDFDCNHCAIFVGGDRPIAHVVTEGYKLPGLRLTKVPPGKFCVFRINDAELAKSAASIIKAWAMSSRLMTRQEYLTNYPERFWGERTARDLSNFFQILVQ